MNSTPPASSLPRRDFLKKSALLGVALSSGGSLTAAERRRSIGANDRIRIGIIGCGRRGLGMHIPSILKLNLEATNLEIVALADPWRIAREQANEVVRESFGRPAKEFVSYRDLLAMDGIDAVMIASPDHLHTTHLEAAAKAGKHIYVEKPLATELDKLIRAVDAVKAAGTVVQVGTQTRSLPAVVGAREVVQSGILGKLSLIDESRNSENPYWYKRLVNDVREADVDWKEFLGDRPMRPFDPEVYSGWYGHYEFCQGPVPQWGAHFLDTVHYMTGAGFPESCVCSGGIFTWRDEHNFTTPDCVQATWIYPEGFMLRSSNNFGNGAGNSRKFFGVNGTLNVDSWNLPSYSAIGGLKRDGSIRGKVEVQDIDRPDHVLDWLQRSRVRMKIQLNVNEDHVLDWLQCMRSGQTPHAPIEAGYQHAIAVLMAVMSYDTGRKTIYDAHRRTIRTA